MTDSPRWERESQEDLRPTDCQPSTADAELPPVPDAELPRVPDAEQPPTPHARQRPVPDAEQPPTPHARQRPTPDSEQPLTPRRHPAPRADALPQDTVEFDIRRAGFDPDEPTDPPQFTPADSSQFMSNDPPEYTLDGAEDDEEGDWPPRSPRLAAARESLAATRGSVAQSLSAGRQSVSTTAGRAGRWFAALDRRPEFDAGEDERDPVAHLAQSTGGRSAPAATTHDASETAATTRHASETIGEDAPATDPSDSVAGGGHRFPTTALGYNRQAVDAHVSALEAELARLREVVDPPMSITEEIERLGEQTASILVVAHDKAHETARRAQQQAARAVSRAADDAERITTDAQRRLRELDEETDAVWRERERLLDDVREVSRTLATVADAASARFPAAASTDDERTDDQRTGAGHLAQTELALDAHQPSDEES